MNNRKSNISIKSTDSKIFYKLKLILIGDSGVGKTSLLNRYMGEQFIPNQPCTINADFKIKSIRIDELTFAEIIIWDTCGQERYRSMTRQYFQDAHGIILVYDVCDKRSFADLNIWLEEIKKNSIKENISIILCGNKIDLKFRNTSFEEASTFAKNNDILYCETSSKEGFNIETAFEKLIKDIIEKMNRNSQFDTETRKSASLRESTKAVSGKERKREKEVKCC